MSTLDPSTRATVDQVHAEAFDDYQKLLSSARSFLAGADGSRVDASVALTSAILAEPSWDHMTAVSVLGVALVETASAEAVSIDRSDCT